MMVERKGKVKAKWRVAEEETAWMKEEIRAAAMKAEQQAATVELDFHISYWLHISFRFISDWYSEKI